MNAAILSSPDTEAEDADSAPEDGEARWLGLRLLRVNAQATDHDYIRQNLAAGDDSSSGDENADDPYIVEVAIENAVEQNVPAIEIAEDVAEQRAENGTNNDLNTEEPIERLAIPNVEPTAAAVADVDAAGSSNILAENAANLPGSSQNSTNALSAPSVISLNTPSPAKKRKRTADETPKLGATPRLSAKSKDEDSDEDDGCTCPICFDKWEMVGTHRLVSLRCGHLFGESCIKRWLTECSRQSGQKMCPQCKAKATNRDIRHLYAKRVRVVDRSEEHELRKALEDKTRVVQSLEMEISVLKMKEATSERRLQTLETENTHLRLTLCSRPTAGSSSASVSISLSGEKPLTESLQPLKSYKLFMEHNINLSREQGCRVMSYSQKQCQLYVSQKSAAQLFAGYGIRLIDASTFRALNFVHLTAKELRDITLSADEQDLVCTSQETTAKLYDFRMREARTIGPFDDNQNLWACALGDHGNENTLYLGTQQGSTTVVDIRFPNTSRFDVRCSGDLSPVFSVAVIPRSEEFPHGGFCIGKLQSIWFYENSADEEAPTAFRLDIEGPFLAMCFEPTQQLLVITTRKSMRYPESRFIVGKIKKSGTHVVFEPRSTFIGAKNTPVMTRGCQIRVPSNTLFAAFIQDAKQLALFDIRRQTRLQSLPVSDIIYDTCPIYTARDTYVAALTGQRCRIYKLNDI